MAPAAFPSTGGLTAALQPFVDDQTMAGAVVLVGAKDKILALEAVGWSDLEAKRPMAADDFFWIASMTKAMTATAVMMLVDEGRVSVEDPVEKYLPEFKGQVVIAKDDATKTPRAPSHPMQIREILSNTSGLPFRSEIEQGALDRLPIAEAVASYAKTPLLSDPGAAYLYSNAGFNTAARIIEVVSGMSYEQFLQERLFDPLGMSETTFWPSAAQLRRLAKVYTGREGAIGLHEAALEQLTCPLDDKSKRFPMAAGGLFSPAIDVARFCQMCLNDGVHAGRRVLSAAGVRRMTAKETAAGKKIGYGFGWSVDDQGGFAHGGALNTYMSVDPARGVVTVFLVQQGARWGTSAERGKEIMPAVVKAVQAMTGGPASDTVVRIEGQGAPR
jgi:CubicO group peptidase (beta-lactamase class C family)